MKKILCILLTLILVISFGTSSFAAVTTYDTDKSQVVDNTLVSSANEVVPLASALPKTGGIPAEAYYIVGVLMVAGALVISRIKPKASTKN